MPSPWSARPLQPLAPRLHALAISLPSEVALGGLMPD